MTDNNIFKRHSFISINRGTIFSYGADPELIHFLEEFRIKEFSTHYGAAVRGFNRFFNQYFDNRTPSDLYDFSEESFEKDVQIIMDVVSSSDKYTPGFLRDLYKEIISDGYGNFSVFVREMFDYNNFISDIKKGFKVVIYNPVNDIPEGDKWLIWKDNNFYKFDFSEIIFDAKKLALKGYIWQESSPSLANKKKTLPRYMLFLNLLKNGIPLEITPSNVIEFTQSLGSMSSTSKHVFISSIKDFVNYMKACDLCSISDIAMSLFKAENVRSTGYKDSYSAKEIKEILNKMDQFISMQSGIMKSNYQLRKIMVQIANETPVRSENISRLKLNCLEKIGDSNKYYLHYNPKNYVDDRIPLTDNVFNLFKQAIELTKPLRKIKSNNNEFIFIYERKRGSTIDVISSNRVSAFVNQICDELGIPKRGLKGVRNHYMNKVTKVAGSKGSNGVQMLESLSRHSLAVHFNNYSDIDLDTICTEMYGITVGVRDLKGVISRKDSIYEKKSIVLQGRGFCTVSTCEDRTLCDCLMCRRFKTTPSCIPFFEEEIKKIEERIACASSDEEVKFLNAMKSLNLKYLTELYKAVEKGENYE